MKGDQDDPFTHDDLTGARRMKWCKCSTCGKVEICTPSNDFYGDFTVGAPLQCEGCVLGGTPLLMTIGTDGRPR